MVFGGGFQVFLNVFMVILGFYVVVSNDVFMFCPETFWKMVEPSRRSQAKHATV